ncbi:MAG: hypothetical protein ACI87J_001543 [Colwellia sp.]|jgi:hypothetical protein
MSVTILSDYEISIIGNFAEKIKLGKANEICTQLAKQNLEAFNLRNNSLKEEYSFKYVPNADIPQGRSIIESVRVLMVNSFINKEGTLTDKLISRIYKNTIAIEFGEQLFEPFIGKQCRVKHNYNLINFIVGEFKRGFKIASFDESKQVFRLFNAQKDSVTALSCNHLSLQQVNSLIYKIEKPILEDKSRIIENSVLVAYKILPDDLFTLEFKDQISDKTLTILNDFSVKHLKGNVWQVPDNIYELLRRLSPRGHVYI